mmetsp:Transcript_37510/g.107362  ORF Transcript_37510/g.107362 Transcript_37510/m.107362 type:complete len:82 (-) Transcript_37510:320-565(-)
MDFRSVSWLLVVWLAITGGQWWFWQQQNQAVQTATAAVLTAGGGALGCVGVQIKKTDSPFGNVWWGGQCIQVSGGFLHGIA